MLPPSIAYLLRECEETKRGGQYMHMHMYAWREKYEEKINTRQKNIRKGKRTEDYLALKYDFKQICLPFPE